jgi:hypothetical protein
MKEVAERQGFIFQKIFQFRRISGVKNCGSGIRKVIQLNPEQSGAAIQKSILRSKRFSAQGFVDSIEDIYLKLIDNK